MNNNSPRISFLLVVLLILLSDCKRNGNDKILLSERENTVLSEILKNSEIASELNLNGINYLVYPYFEEFAFNKYTVKNYKDSERNYQKKNKILKQLGWSDEDFREHAEQINEKYQSKQSESLMEMSKGNKSEWVVCFSGIGKEFLFLEVFNFCGVVQQKALSKKFDFNQPKKEVYSFVVLLNENQVTEILVENIVALELQCD